MSKTVYIAGAGLAGCEAALWLAGRGFFVRLFEQKPVRYSPAHQNADLAELVCSNSFKADRLDSAGGLLKAEMRLLGSSLLPLADACKVAAGGALAVDRDQFSALVTKEIERHPNIQLIREPVASVRDWSKEHPVIIATGPLTEGPLADEISFLTGGEPLAFYDAAAPIVTSASLDREKIFAASRYGRGGDDYLNCPFNKDEYEAFYAALVEAEAAPLHDFDQNIIVYEGCMPVEVMARRGPDTLRFGPMRPVGLRDPRTGHRPWANLQLRRENAEGAYYNLVGFQTNLKFGEQKRIFSLIPGLEKAEFVRYGVMHRNTFLNSPVVLNENLSLKNCPQLRFAGQITGFEGYMESAASGLLAARSIADPVYQPPPIETMCGALLRYSTAPNKDFQPMGANMGLLPPLGEPVKGKRERYMALSQRALQALQQYLCQEAWLYEYTD